MFLHIYALPTLLMVSIPTPTPRSPPGRDSVAVKVGLIDPSDLECTAANDPAANEVVEIVSVAESEPQNLNMKTSNFSFARLAQLGRCPENQALFQPASSPLGPELTFFPLLIRIAVGRTAVGGWDCGE